jgi:hypothetical protein
VKNRENRLFWTVVGLQLLEEPVGCNTSELPSEMLEALKIPIKIPEKSISMRGLNLEGKKGRHIYMHTWNTLRDMGFSRPLRREVLPGVEVLIPFVKGDIAVVPQGFQNRIPLKLRAFALVGKSAVLRAAGYHLVVAAALYKETAWSILSRGECTVCTLDKLGQIITTLDLHG